MYCKFSGTSKCGCWAFLRTHPKENEQTAFWISCPTVWVPLDNALCFLDFGDTCTDDCLDRLKGGDEAQGQAIWLSSPIFYSAGKKEHQYIIALFETYEAIYSMQVLGSTLACRADHYQILYLQKLLAGLAYSVHFQKNFVSVQKQFTDQDRECGALPST